MDVSLLDLVSVAGASLAAGGLLIMVLMPGRVDRIGASLIGLGWLAVIVSLVPARLHDRPVVLTLLLLVGIATALGLAWALRTRMRILYLVGGLVAPIRLPIELGGETANLLVPIYGVTAVGIALLVLGSDQVRNTQRSITVLDLGVGILAALALISVSWAIKVEDAALAAGAFIIPFSALYMVIRRSWDAPLVRVGAMGFIAMTTVSALVGIVQHTWRFTWQNSKVEVANAFGSVFRTNSIFYDPNIYGRYLVAGMLLLLAWGLLRTPTRGGLRWGWWALMALHTIALWWTYSQSSMVALAAGAVVLSAWVGSRRLRYITYIALVAGVVGGTLLLTLSPQRVLDRGRREVAATGVTLAAARPVHGLGIGTFVSGVTSLETDRGGRPPGLRASHTTPVTIAAELGVLGVGAWAFLLAAASAVMVGTAAMAQRFLDSARGSELKDVAAARSLRLPLRQVAAGWGAATFAAVVAHSMFYAAFLEDPLTWIALAALGSGARLNPRAA